MARPARILMLAAAAALLALGPVAADEGPGALHASATLRDGNGVDVGWARFTEDSTGVVHVAVHVTGLAPGLHGIHIHAIGACTPTFAAAGSHHNPLGATHGGHAGDLPNLIVNPAGIGHLETTTEAATLSAGPISVFDLNGSALIVHAGPDDYVTDPTGNSGARIACGVITAD